MTLQFLDGNLSEELLVHTNGNTVCDCFAANQLKRPPLLILQNLLQAFIISIAIAARGTC